MIAIKFFILVGIAFVSTPIEKSFNREESAYKNHCISEEEMRLYVLINDYRRQRRLPPVPLSKSLSYVARQHVVDLQYNVKKVTHSWSRCRYKSGNQRTYDCMWLKPRELTSYNSYGYECVYGTTHEYAGAKDALETWKKSPNHNNVIINRDIWHQVEWKAIGIGIYKNYAAIWFGEEEDEEGQPEMCS